MNKQLQILRKRAEKGDVEAASMLGCHYADGDGIEQDDTEAYKWFFVAAQQGDLVAQFNLGLFYEQGRGTKQNPSEAVKWYLKAATEGCAEAQCNLGACYHDGFGVERSEEDAVQWYLLAAEQGMAQAQFNLGISYLSGDGVERNTEKAVTWMLKAAEQNHARAQYKMGVIYYAGEGVEKNFDNAVMWWKKAAAQRIPKAQYMVGKYYLLHRKNYLEAEKWLWMAADQRYRPAIKLLGLRKRWPEALHHQILCRLASLANQDLQEWICEYRVLEADDWINQLNEFDREKFINGIDDDNIDALYSVGCCYYLHGDIARAIQWWNLVAENDYDHRAKFMLGCCYWNAEGIGRDLTKARYWFREAMEAGSPYGAYYLGSVYELGIGVSQSDKKALNAYITGLEHIDENISDEELYPNIRILQLAIKKKIAPIKQIMREAKECLEEYINSY